MPTRDPVKNLEYVRESQQKTKEAIGVEAFNNIHSSAQSKYRNNLKQANGLDEYKKQQAEYMKEYRAKQRQMKQEALKKENALKVLTDAIRFRKAKQEMTLLKQKKADEAKKRVKRPVGRPRKPRNPVGRPKGSKNKPKK
jgi:hypothetical protein